MSMYNDYLKELNGKRRMIEGEMGFAIYSIIDSECVYEDIYIVPEHRGTDAGVIISDLVYEAGKEANCKYMTGFVHLDQAGWAHSKRFQEKYGMREIGRDMDTIYMAMEIK